MSTRTAPFVSIVLLAIACCAGIGSADAGVIFGEDFSSGLPSGTTNATDYTLTPTGVFTIPASNGVYRVVSDPANPTFTNNYTDFYDHTTGTARGAMLFFDGSPSQDRVFYRNASLVAGSTYTFSFWAAADNYLNTPTLIFTLDGTQLGSSLSTVDGQWRQFTTSFVASHSGLATFAIVDLQTIDQGNDGALDDVSLVGPDVVVPPGQGVPEPGEASLVALGFAAAAFTRRRRTRR